MLRAQNIAWLIAALATMHWLGGCATYTLGRPNPKNNPYNALNNLRYENQSSKLAWARGWLGHSATPNRRDRFERTPLMIAAAFGDRQLISQLLVAGNDVNATDFAENNALMYAGAYGNAAGLSALLQANPDLQARNKNKETALHVAASAPGGKADCVRKLIEAGCDINARDFIDHSPLARAAGKEGDLARLRVLLEHNHDDQNEAANLQRLDDALSQAASGSRADAIPVLLDAGADLQAVDKGRRTPLHAAANYGNRETITVLIQAGADLESHGHSTGGTPLILSASWGTAETTHALIDLGADLEGRDESGRTALMHVATTRIHDQHGYAQPPDDVYARMDTLIAYTDDLEATDNEGRTALFHAVSSRGDVTRISRLLEAGADVNAADRQAVTVLMQASANKRGEVVASLLQLGAKVSLRDDHGRSALMWAATHGSWRVPYAIDVLLQAGADIDARDKDGWAALGHAAESLQRGSIYLLLKNGANPSDIGWTPLHRAIGTGDQIGIWTALEADGDLEARDMWGRTALIWASRFIGYSPTIRQLSKVGADLEATDNDGRTALMHAAISAYREEVCVLMELGANIHTTDRDGMTALMHAAGRTAGKYVVHDLLERGADAAAIDIQGRTALDHARAISNSAWRRGTVELLEAIENDSGS